MSLARLVHANFLLWTFVDFFVEQIDD